MSAVISTSLPEVIASMTGPILSNPTPPLPGMLYWGPDGKETWFVDANGQPQKLSDLQITPTFVADASKFIYNLDDVLWENDRLSGNRRRLFSFARLLPWYRWSAETGVVWFFDTSRADDQAMQAGMVKMLDERGNVLDLAEGFSFHGPVVAPDGKSIAFDEAGQPAVYHLEKAKQSLDLAANGLSLGLDFYSPSWSPDGQLLAWAAYDRESDAYSVIIFNLETGSARVVQLDEHPNWYIYTPLWHPESNKLSIMRSGGGSADTTDGWIINLKTQEKIFMGAMAEVQWSPNGDWLAYTLRMEEGHPFVTAIWVMTEDGREQHNLGYGEYLIWSPDGRYLTYCGIEETGYEGFGRWQTSPENGWISTQIDFGYQEGCNFVQWLEIDKPELAAYVLPHMPIASIPPTPAPTITLFHQHLRLLSRPPAISTLRPQSGLKFPCRHSVMMCFPIFQNVAIVPVEILSFPQMASGLLLLWGIISVVITYNPASSTWKLAKYKQIRLVHGLCAFYQTMSDLFTIPGVKGEKSGGLIR
ncbi:MAG TPA: hypothetical protein PLK31_13790 [Chloroflexota bacterium]|nr:hypothetical protein [Chloroflexota bacterium]